MTRNLQDPTPAIASTPRFYSETLDWLGGYHADYGQQSTHAGAVVYEVLLRVGDAPSTLSGPASYQERLVPMLGRFQQPLAGLELCNGIRRTDLLS
jgi:hypothetical protein